MTIWLPRSLYQVFPLLCVLVGFFLVMFVKHPACIVIALVMYVYSFSVLWMRSHEADCDEA